MNIFQNPVRAGQLAAACFTIGFLFMFPFEAWWAQLFGMLFLCAGAVLGSIAILTPRFLGEEPKENELPPSGSA